jgi:hypothetical protein
MPKTEMDYAKTVIYKLCCKNPLITDIYIGHTTNFIQRKKHHKNSYNNINNKEYNKYAYKFIRDNGGWDNWNMVQIEEFSCKNKREAEAKEHQWIVDLKASLNKYMPYAMYKETPQIYQHNWYEENKEQILERVKDNYYENKEHKIAYQKEYSQEHKEEIKDYNKEYRELNKDKLSEQKKVYRKENKEILAEGQKKWREENKDKIKDKNSEIIQCECGNNYTVCNKLRHLQSKTHFQFQNKLNDAIDESSEADKIEKLHQKQKEYREKNAEKISECKKKCYEKNKDKTKEQMHTYYENNRDKILENTKLYAENNKEKLKSYYENRYSENKEKILERQNQLYVCDCGSEIRFGGKAEHLRSVKHKNYMNNLVTL